MNGKNRPIKPAPRRGHNPHSRSSLVGDKRANYGHEDTPVRPVEPVRTRRPNREWRPWVSGAGDAFWVVGGIAIIFLILMVFQGDSMKAIVGVFGS